MERARAEHTFQGCAHWLWWQSVWVCTPPLWWVFPRMEAAGSTRLRELQAPREW